MSSETLPTLDCPNHPGTPAPYVCAHCQAAVCVDCCYTMPDGSICCKNCYASPAPVAADPAPAPAGPAAEAGARPRIRLRLANRADTAVESRPPPVIPPGMGCVQHPSVRAVATCKRCGARCCSTCDFIFDNLHLCPVCASAPESALSPRRKHYVIAAFCFAAWSTLGIAVLLSGVLARAAKESELLIGLLISLVMLVPSVIGTAMAMSAMRKGGNRLPVWAAIIWNCLILGGLGLLFVVGALAK